MKATFIALLAVLLCLGGCGKKAAPEPEQTKAPSKPTPKKETPKSKPEPKFDPTKHERFLWEFETGDVVRSSPAIGSDGTVYLGSWDKKLYAINAKTRVIQKKK